MNLRLLVILFVIILVSVSYYDFYISLLLFFMIFQILASREVILNLKGYIKTRKGIYADGKVISTRKIEQGEEKPGNFEYTVEFTNPQNKQKGHLLYLEKSLKPRNRNLRVWIDLSQIKNSIIVDEFNFLWTCRIVFFIIIVLALVLADISLLKKSSLL